MDNGVAVVYTAIYIYFIEKEYCGLISYTYRAQTTDGMLHVPKSYKKYHKVLLLVSIVVFKMLLV